MDRIQTKERRVHVEGGQAEKAEFFQGSVLLIRITIRTNTQGHVLEFS